MKAKIRESALLFPDLSYIIQGAAFAIRKEYGPGQKEIIYRRLMEEKLKLKGLKVKKEQKIKIYSQDTGKIRGIYQPDLVIENKILIEIKSSRFTTKLDEKQLYFYLRNSNYELGYLINFSTPKLLIKRIVYSNNRKPHVRVDSFSVSH
jgi:GxxExxY protein